MQNLMEFSNPKKKRQQKDQPKKMTLAAFGPWMQEKCGAEYMIRDERTDCVASINHIEPGCYAALYAMPSPEGLEIFELADYFPSKTEAWEALQCHAETYLPVLFEEWVKEQYITDKNAVVEKLEI